MQKTAKKREKTSKNEQKRVFFEPFFDQKMDRVGR